MISTFEALSMRRVDPLHPPVEHLRLQRDSPISCIEVGDGQRIWAVTKHADVRAMLGDVRFSSDRSHPQHPSHGGYRPGAHKGALIAIDPPEHTVTRGRVMNEFTVKKINAKRPRVEEIVSAAIDALLAGERPADLVEALSLPVPSLVIGELLGVPYDDHEFFQTSSATVTDRFASDEDRLTAMVSLRTYISSLVDARVHERGDDILSRQLDAGADPEEAVGLGFLLLVAGHETTANMISLSIATLLDRPDLLQQLREDPHRIPGAVEELLRYFTIAEVGGQRLAIEDVELAGHLIHQGDVVVALTHTANRDPDVFSDPDRIDFSRGSRNHMAFGFGPHQCLGQNLARLELVVVIEQVLARIPSLALAVPFSELRFKEFGPNYGVYELPVTW
ncbi:cytochrome P450 [Rathayibacter sp. VKM Ac-2835]|uniref:cytochrome P450 n=1 Tax=Rathayibacter sp. VKM Ac-2835 TaxID=2739043 RepID=UPI001565B1AF|nr:cytochrome P450 [Rathayibacter sp. VKM Ac-2835]NRG41056.1 cytochrome P450 [Rathayibacter sp. VKM Ac-2835]